MKIIFQICMVTSFACIVGMFVAQQGTADGQGNVKPIIRSDTLYEPLFDISYRPHEIRFPKTPSSLDNCKDLKMRREDMFLFGHISKGNTNYYLVSGWLEMHPDGPSDVRNFEAGSGIIVIVSPTQCQHIGADYAWSKGEEFRQKAEKLGVTKDIVFALVSNAIDQEVKAFGGKTEFLRRLKETGVKEEELPEPMRAKLAILRGSKK